MPAAPGQPATLEQRADGGLTAGDRAKSGDRIDDRAAGQERIAQSPSVRRVVLRHPRLELRHEAEVRQSHAFYDMALSMAEVMTTIVTLYA